MNTLMNLRFSVFGCLIAGITFAQLQNNQGEFDDFTYRQGSVYRTASGYPGSEYFQNEANYRIKATLDPQTNTIKGWEEIEYINNSKQNLDYVWMYVEQNRFTADSRSNLANPIGGNRFSGDTDKGMSITRLVADSRGVKSSKYLITGTRMQVFFKRPIVRNGGKARIRIKFEYKIPHKGMDRMGTLETKNGVIYALAQWFPQVAVYDDVVGWNVEPYLGSGEFYYDYGDFNVDITVPYDYLVVASGELQNPKEVLSSKVYNRYQKAKSSNKVVTIIGSDELNEASIRSKNSGTLTWKFKLKNARDVAFAASKAFIWDGARGNLPNGKKTFIHSVYPIESKGENAWSRSTEYTKAAIEHYSKKWFPYPYPSAVNVAADVNGMEYPGLSFCAWKSKNAPLWGVTNHEFGHDWFPMIVGSNERRYAWMDEGFNTFINHYSTLDFNKGEYPSRLSKINRYMGWFLSAKRESIDTYPDVVQTSNLGMTAYVKPALGLYMLREYILEPERFDYAFRSYIKTWAYKHPQPSDFFNHMENASGENLNWFWKNWFYGTGNIDLAIDDVVRNFDGNYQITISNKGDIPMPVKFKVTYEDKTTDNKKLPVEIWLRGNTWKFIYKADKPVKKIQIDADNLLVDTNRRNNFWRSSK